MKYAYKLFKAKDAVCVILSFNRYLLCCIGYIYCTCRRIVPIHYGKYEFLFFCSIRIYIVAVGNICVAYSTTYLIKPQIALRCKNIILWICIICLVLYYLCMILFTISNFTDINTFVNRLIGNYFLRTHLMYNAKVYTMFLGFIIGSIVNTEN